MRLRITPGALLLLFVLLLQKNALLAVTVIAVLLHEAGHLLAAARLGIRIRTLELDLIGAQIYPATLLPSYRAELLLALGGPLASFLLFLITLPFGTDFMTLLGRTSLSLALFNLLPVSGFDGGRMLFSLLAAPFGERIATRAVAVTSYLSLLLLFLLSACLLLRYGQNAALALLSTSLFARLFLPPSGRRY